MNRFVSRCVVCLHLFVIINAGAQGSMLWREGISLIPYPQKVLMGGDNFVFNGPVSIVLDQSATEADNFAAQNLIKRLSEEWKIEATISKTITGKSVVLTRQMKPLPEEFGEDGYFFSVDVEKITIASKGEAGLFYGTCTLLQLIQPARAGLIIKGMEIQDWPDIQFRAVHYDTKHHQDKASYVKQFIRQLSDYKINMLIWEWEDKFAYKSHPDIGAPGAFTKEEMQEFTRYARKYHIQLVPLVQGLGHVSYILKWPQYHHLCEIPASNWEFCPYKEGTYDVLFDLWNEAMEATPGVDFIHIGTDETYEVGAGIECGCKERAGKIGKRGILLHFVNRCTVEMQKKGRRVISWGGEYRPGAKLQPTKGLIVAEFTDDLEIARLSSEAGYPVWIYDPNPGIEQLFLPYFHRRINWGELGACLDDSYHRVSLAANSGLFEGMVNTSWDDAGLHNQVWMMTFVNSAEWSWNGGAPTLDEFIDKYFVNYYGPEAQDMRELWTRLNHGSYYYMDTFERRVWHAGPIGKTHLPVLPRHDNIEIDYYWSMEYADMIKKSEEQVREMRRVINICKINRINGVKNSYDFEVFQTIAELIQHTARTYVAIRDLEKAIVRAHTEHFTNHTNSYQAMTSAVKIINDNLEERDFVYNNLVSVWEKTRLPKGMSTPEKKFFHEQDRARHFAFRTADMSYLVLDEQMLGLEEYFQDLKVYMNDYKERYLK